MYAYFTPNNYTVYFNSNGGNTVNPASKVVTFDSVYGNLASATKRGHDLVGWYTEATGGTKIESSTNMTTANNHTLYAHWTPTTYKVTVNVINGTGTSTRDIVFERTTSATIKPNAGLYNPIGYYLSSITCTNGYTATGYTTGRNATGEQTITINNNSNDTNATCTVTYESLNYDAHMYCDGGRTLSNGNCTYYYSNNGSKCGTYQCNPHDCNPYDCSYDEPCTKPGTCYKDVTKSASKTGTVVDSYCSRIWEENGKPDQLETGFYCTCSTETPSTCTATWTLKNQPYTCQKPSTCTVPKTCYNTCYDTCNNSCTLTENEYRKYSCPNGGTLDETTCVF